MSEVKNLPIGYFGASTGAVGAIEASVHFDKVYAIVLRGGRPDLASATSLIIFTASTLLIIGSKDSKVVIDLNKKAFKQLRNVKFKKLVMIPNAGHLFEEEDEVDNVHPISFCMTVASCLNSVACCEVNCPLTSFAFIWSKNAPNGPQASSSLLFSSCFAAAFRGACKFVVPLERPISLNFFSSSDMQIG